MRSRLLAAAWCGFRPNALRNYARHLSSYAVRYCWPELPSHAQSRWDFVSAFLQAELEPGEVVYCSAPPGPYATSGQDDRPRVWRVNKPVYGMAQAGRRWQRSLFSWLTDYGFEPCSADSCVFTLRREVQTSVGPRQDVVIIGCYVDDLFILHNEDDDCSLYSQFTSDLSKRSGGMWKTRVNFPIC